MTFSERGLTRSRRATRHAKTASAHRRRRRRGARDAARAARAAGPPDRLELLAPARASSIAGRGRRAVRPGSAATTPLADVAGRCARPRHRGLPADEHGFIRSTATVASPARPTSSRRRRRRPTRRTGGLATQQAGTWSAGRSPPRRGDPHGPAVPPVLRGMLLTGAPRSTCARKLPPRAASPHGHARAELHGEVSIRALWWPPGKVAAAIWRPTSRPPGRPTSRASR